MYGWKLYYIGVVKDREKAHMNEVLLKNGTL